MLAGRQSALLGIRAVVMVGFCSQGDNIQDAVAMAARLDSWIGLKKDVRSSLCFEILCYGACTEGVATSKLMEYDVRWTIPIKPVLKSIR